MSKWLNKFKESPIVSTDSVDTLPTMSTLSVSYTPFNQNYYSNYFAKHGYEQTLEEWIYNNPPAEQTLSHCAYCGDAIDFTGGFQTVGGLHLCHHSRDDEHLKPYLQSRTAEATKQLHQIGVTKND